MSNRKQEQQLTNSYKFLDQIYSTCNPRSNQQTYEQDRYSFHNQNSARGYPKHLKPQNTTKKEQIILVQRNQNLQTKKINLSKSPISQSLIGKLKKLGYVSNPASKPSSPNKKKDNKTHRRNISAHNAQTQFSTIIIKNTAINKTNFEYHHVIGRGGFGKVWKVQAKKSKKVYAMKQMLKSLVITKKSVPSVLNEKKILSGLKNPFIVNMICSFQDRQTLYLVMDYLPGGDLRHHIARKKKFSQEQAKFIICCILLGLTYLHENNIIHRDIKPQNLVLDSKGYVRVTDMGIARVFRQNNAQDTSGTPGYMAPQVLCRQNHSFSVDYFALGIIAYELMLRKRPYSGRSRKQIRDQVLARQVQIKRYQIPDNWSLQAADFINRLIQRKPQSRLGTNGSQQIRNHPWLRQFPFDKLVNKSLVAPFIPDPSLADQSFDSANISEQNTQVQELMRQNQIILRKPQVQELFQGYQSSHDINI